MSNTNRRTLTAIALLVLSGVCCAGWSRAAVAYVVEPGTGGVIPGEPYNTWTNAATNIAMAVDYVAASGDAANTVWVSNGTYVLTGQVTVTNNMAIIGTNNMPIVDGGGNYRCFYFNAGITGALENLFVTGGYAAPGDPDGAGVYMYNGVLRNCVFSNNVAATNGGGLYFNRADLDVSDSTNLVYGCTFTANQARDGAGSYFIGSNDLHFIVDNSTFYTNVASRNGGGIYAYSQNVVPYAFFTNCNLIANWAGNDGGGCYPRAVFFEDCRISNNYAYVRGGGAGAAYGSRNTFTNCIIYANIAREYGAGLYIYASVQIYGCTIVSNKVSGTGGGNRGGGGVYMTRDGSVIKNSTISYNEANRGGGLLMLGGKVYNSLIINNKASYHDYLGGGVHLVDVSTYPAYFHNCTIAGNYAGSDSGGGLHANNTTQRQQFENTIIYGNSNSVNSVSSNYYVRDTSNITFTNCCFAPELSGAAGDYSVNNMVVNPLFVANDYHLQPSSPCINRGINRAWMDDSLDLDNNPRIRNVIVDMGCYERFLSGAIYSIR